MRTELEEATTDMASRGLRTLCMTYRDFPANVERPTDFFETPPDSELICCAITGIKASCNPCLTGRKTLLHISLADAFCCCVVLPLTNKPSVSAAITLMDMMLK